jgi:hypothetical protein
VSLRDHREGGGSSEGDACETFTLSLYCTSTSIDSGLSDAIEAALVDLTREYSQRSVIALVRSYASNVTRAAFNADYSGGYVYEMDGSELFGRQLLFIQIAEFQRWSRQFVMCSSLLKLVNIFLSPCATPEQIIQFLNNLLHLMFARAGNYCLKLLNPREMHLNAIAIC